ncbi:hypothetical protein H2O64_01900 [Kordia sp. YSTF-M3]|uniref:Uncharacterized protein n=1 Tax=Kordia aestuariivivens TaxID=2759037 RepID=A0ABR7Q4C7_9FLAO|nr:hypothetical protein [Kordia aestuariivivens]MBC8753405.1 hypothetical protein [Kordia aestuariivivens]
MHITSTSYPNNSKISFAVQVERLHEAITKTDIALGTSAKPIPIDTFVTINDANLYEFKSGETIAFQLVKPDGSVPEKMELELVACRIHNVGQDFNASSVTILDPWKKVFDTSPENILELPDSSLSIKPIDDICAITVAKGAGTDILTSFLSYEVIFKSTIDITEPSGESKLRTFYFVIDPLIKITSGGRGGGTF